MMKRRILLGVAVALLPLACTPRPVPTAPAAPPSGFAGRVVHADGTPASDAVVIISDPATSDELAVARSAADGHFTTSLKPAVYALTATADQQVAYLPAVEGLHGPVEVRLEATCQRFEGHIRTRSRLPESSLVRLPRMSDHMGDVFGAVVSADGTFRACVPAATYAVKPPEGFAARNAMVVIPYRGDFEYRTALQQDADRVPADLSGIAPESTASFVAALPASTKVLGLGESNHGTREFYEERTALVKALAAKQGVRILMIEAGYGEVLALDDYVNGAALDVASAVQQLGYWTWDTKTFLQTLADIRAYNASLPADKRIHVIGFDVQNTSGAIKYLEERHVLSTAETSSLAKLATDDGKSWTTLDSAERVAIRATLGRISSSPTTGGASSVASRTALAARSLLLHFDTLEAADDWQGFQLRDAGMARMVLEVLAAEPNGRATLWAHLGHLSREYVVGQPSLGAHLATALGDSYRVYGLLAVAGSARAWDFKQEVGVVAGTLRTPPAYSVEAVLSGRAGRAPVTYWTFASAKGDAAQWLHGIHALRSFGAVFMPEGHDFSYWDLHSFDGAILFQSVSPTVPTPTGERRAKPKEP